MLGYLDPSTLGWEFDPTQYNQDFDLTMGKNIIQSAKNPCLPSECAMETTLHILVGIENSSGLTQ